MVLKFTCMYKRVYVLPRGRLKIASCGQRSANPASNDGRKNTGTALSFCWKCPNIPEVPQRVRIKTAVREGTEVIGFLEICDIVNM